SAMIDCHNNFLFFGSGGSGTVNLANLNFTTNYEVSDYSTFLIKSDDVPTADQQRELCHHFNVFRRSPSLGIRAGNDSFTNVPCCNPPRPPPPDPFFIFLIVIGIACAIFLLCAAIGCVCDCYEKSKKNHGKSHKPKVSPPRTKEISSTDESKQKKKTGEGQVAIPMPPPPYESNYSSPLKSPGYCVFCGRG
ncbi:hypothetical protein PMAYCL1PPCAC_31164, partial [Pristionchus mayeri]